MIDSPDLGGTPLSMLNVDQILKTASNLCAIRVGHQISYLNKYDTKKGVMTLKMKSFHSSDSESSPCCSIATPAVAETIQMIVLLGVDIAVSLCHLLELRGKLVRG